MAEVSGMTELQLLESEKEVLEKVLEGLKQAENTSDVCSQIVASIQKAEASDGFLAKEGGQSVQNQFHSSAPAASGDGGCCVVL
mmetsp:Transcript_25610/g.36098  ORF Transcript_25610/g.36098 Transcript_25610/m.36098 type:complete len:84 (-) Transcript_25610:224-475(-)